MNTAIDKKAALRDLFKEREQSWAAQLNAGVLL
jgi:hypothetical protein